MNKITLDQAVIIAYLAALTADGKVTNTEMQEAKRSQTFLYYLKEKNMADCEQLLNSSPRETLLNIAGHKIFQELGEKSFEEILAEVTKITLIDGKVDLSETATIIYLLKGAGYTEESRREILSQLFRRGQ